MSFSSRARELWPSIQDHESALRVSRRGFVGAIFQAGSALMFAWMARKTSYAGFSISTFLIAAVIFGVIAIGIWRLSRVAAVLGLVLFVPDAIWMSLDVRGVTDLVKALVLILFLTLLFANGVRGTFAYHKSADAEPEADTPPETIEEKRAV